MANIKSSSVPKQLSLLGFFAITASMVMAVYEYPTFATSGFSLVFLISRRIIMVYSSRFMCG